MDLLHTPLERLHTQLQAKMVPFAGYDMPVQYPTGIIAEHLHTRDSAGLFDVSHMGQFVLAGPGSAALLETLLPVDIQGLAIDQQTYALLTNAEGGVRDDLIVTRWDAERFFLVVNAACKADDWAYINSHIEEQQLSQLDDRALLALQGPLARRVMGRFCSEVAELTFMHGCATQLEGVEAYVTCSGYTGEDGFEISLPADCAADFARLLLEAPEVRAIGLGARDSLRLEAGLCLYGHELADDIDPIQAGLTWSISPVRRSGGARAGGFVGADKILPLIGREPPRRRVGLRADGKRPLRDGQPVLDLEGREVGTLSSACYGASCGGPIAMAYVESAHADPETPLQVVVRDKPLPVTVVTMPFVPRRYYRG